MNNKVQHSVILSLIILLTMSGITPALINILPTQLESNQVEEVSLYIVMFGDSPTEQIAKDKLLENFPNSQVITYRETNLLNSFSGPIIYIGHSSIEGISYYRDIIGWDTISEIITSSLSNNHYILGCNSDIITRLTAQTGKNVVSFDFEIDALVGVGVISLHLATIFSLSTFSIFRFGLQALDRLNLIQIWLCL